MANYIYRPKQEKQQERKAFGALPEGDYHFTVKECGEPYFKNEHWILPVRLNIDSTGSTVFANPWSGQNTYGEEKDGIGDFLRAVNRVPKGEEEPDWDSVVGARGKCHLVVEVAQKGKLQGQDVNKVAYFHTPHQLQKKAAPVQKPPQDDDDDIPMQNPF